MSTEKNMEETFVPEPETQLEDNKNTENQNTENLPVEMQNTETRTSETEPEQNTETKTKKYTSEATFSSDETIPSKEEKDTPLQEYDKSTYDEAFGELYTEILNHFRSFSPSEQVAGSITEEHITEYLEGTREERLLAFKERREKRFLTALEILAALTAVVLIVWFLKDNPAILVNILYLIGGLGIFFIWKHPHDKE